MFFTIDAKIVAAVDNTIAGIINEFNLFSEYVLDSI